MRTVRLGERELTPSKVVCVGRNYVAHIEELGNAVPDEMVVFLKPNSAISDALSSTAGGEVLHFETELCYLVEGGRFTAVAVGLDLTRRELQGRLKKAGLPWERAKAFDGAAVFGAFTPLPAGDGPLELELDVDGVPRQRGATDHMLYPPAAILAGLSSFLTLEDGDVVMTGTPAGVGPVVTGARYEARVRSAGQVIAEASWIARQSTSLDTT